VLAEIGRAAYWDYRQEKINLRSNKRLAKVMKGATRRPGSKPRANKVIQWPEPDACIRCGHEKLYRHYKYSKEVIDVRFDQSGLKRWITKYMAYYYRCPACHAVFPNQNRPWDENKYGRNVLLLCAYLNIDLRMPQRRIGVFLREVLGFQLSNNAINKFKEKAALLYKPTYERLLNKVVTGKLIHADETPMNVDGKTGYVWAFASMEDVAYVYAPSREGSLAQALLKDFKGVLVTDFYAAYESIGCPQQKCLLHLIRDLNDDLMKEPFNEELKELVAGFANLLKPMVETVDRFGLKARFLRKHKKNVERFFKNLCRRTYHTETAIKIKSRFEKNRSALFAFLDYDGVPWNNNNAEHAIKAVALLRRNLKGLSTESAINDYLILLSICETCRFKEVSFLDFLRSGEEDIDTYVNSRSSHCRHSDDKARVQEIVMA
jgi:transposase